MKFWIVYTLDSEYDEPQHVVILKTFTDKEQAQKFKDLVVEGAPDYCASVPLNYKAIQRLKDEYGFDYQQGSYTVQVAEGELSQISNRHSSLTGAKKSV